MLTTNDEKVWERAWAYKDIGRSFDAVYRRAHPPGFRWLTDSFGTNWRMTEMQAAIGLLQLSKLDGWIAKRTQHAHMLTAALRTMPGLRLTIPPPYIRHAYYKYYAFIEPQQLAPGWSRDRIVSELSARGVPCFSGSCSEIYLEKAFETVPTRPKQRLTVARELGETSLMFLVHPTLEDSWIRATIEVMEGVFKAALVPVDQSLQTGTGKRGELARQIRNADFIK